MGKATVFLELNVRVITEKVIIDREMLKALRAMYHWQPYCHKIMYWEKLLAMKCFRDSTNL